MTHVKNNLFSSIVIQYLLSITNILVWAIILIIIYKDVQSVYTCWSQILVALSSNICSVACTISFLKKNDEDLQFQNKRSIAIVGSLIPNIILTIVFATETELSKVRTGVILIILTIIIGFMLKMTVCMQCNVGEKNESIKRELSAEDKKSIEEAKRQDKGDVGNQKYIIEGEK